MAKFEFLGRLSDQLDGSSHLSIPRDVTTIAALRPWLNTHFDCDIFSQASTRAIVNQTLATEETVITDLDEIVFYPPVGGG